MLLLSRPAGLRKVVTMSEPILSIGMIVKDEIRCLEKCLKALTPLRKAVPCELVIADTGSTDGTREIAARYADVFFDHPWENDFSAARNAVLARCTGRWYLTLDADEYLDENIDDLVQFLLTPSQVEAEADFGLITISNFVDQSLDKETASSFLGLRMAKLHPGLCYTGKIHERFNISATTAIVNLFFVTLWHDGYAYETPAQARKKSERNMALLKEELEKEPDDPLRIVQCIESCKNLEDKLTYIHRGLDLIRSGASGWEQQGASLLRYAIQVGTNLGLPELQEWVEVAFSKYPDISVTQIDINATLSRYYARCLQWNLALKYADAYWAGVQKLDRGEFPSIEFAAVLVACDSQAIREHMALLQAEACYHLDRFKLARQVLEKVPLGTIGPAHVIGLVGLLARLSTKLNVSKLFLSDAREILEKEPSSREGWRRREALRQALSNLLSHDDPDIPCPYPLLRKLQDEVYAPSAAILSAETADEVQMIAESIPDWKRIPAPVLEKLMELGIPFPQRLFQTVNFEGICQSASYLVNHLEHPIEQILDFTGTLEASDFTSVTWRFELLSAACAWFKWKNVSLANRLYTAFCDASKRYLSLIYPVELLRSGQMGTLLPQNCRFAHQCVQAEEQLSSGQQSTCIQTLRSMLDTAPAMREMVLFLTDRVGHIAEEIQMRSTVSPEMIALAKQIRDVLSQYPEDDPTVFVLKNSEQYQKMKFLIEDPNLDNM